VAGFFSDNSAFEIFDIDIIKGDQQTPLERPNTMVLSKSTAQTIFGDSEAVGKTIELTGFGERPLDFEITAIMEDFPVNSHLDFTYLISMPTLYNLLPDNWTSSRTWKAMYTYVLFRDDADMQDVNAKLREFQYNYLDDILEPERIDEIGDFVELHPITDIHLNSHREQEMGPNSDKSYIYIFSALAVLIILIASANFINIFTSQAIKRLREIGIRKVLGAYRTQLARQFLGESFLLTIFAALIALVLCSAVLPVFNDLSSLNLQAADIFSGRFILMMLSLVVIVGLISGAYPALLLSRMHAVNAFKGDKLPGSTINFVRKGLIILQFGISAFMIISTVIIAQQMNYIRTRDLGFTHEGVVSVRVYGDVQGEVVNNRETIKNSLLAHHAISSVAATSDLMGHISSVEFLLPDGLEYQKFMPEMRFVRTDESFIETMGIELLEGSSFPNVALPDSVTYFIVNEKVVEGWQMEESPIGMMAQNMAMGTRGEIVGVMKNFNFASLREEIEPLVIQYQPSWVGNLLVRIEGESVKSAIAHIEKTIKEISPGSLFSYKFLDDTLAELYWSEQNMTRIFQLFSILAIIISCMGLFGLASYSSRLRIKEIGIRKAFGASIPKIIFLLSRNYLKLIGIAFLIAIPVSNYFLSEWLENFAFRIDISWWVFLLAGIVVIAIGFSAIIGQSLKAAHANPVDSLRIE
jgi:putative ABC transport system permease protein